MNILAGLSALALGLLLAFVIALELIHIMTQGFEGIAYRMFQKHYEQVGQMLRQNKKLYVWVNFLRTTSKTLDWLGIVFGIVMALLVLHTMTGRVLIILALTTLVTQVGYTIIQGGAFGIWILRDIIRMARLTYWKSVYRRTGTLTPHMPIDIPEIVEGEKQPPPPEFNPKEFFRFDLHRLTHDIWEAIDYWGNWKYHLRISYRRVLLSIPRMALYISVIGRLTGII